MPYDLSEAFERIEDELIGSMIRNLDRHRAEETKQGFKWEQWQAVQLKALEDYRKTNMEKFPPRYNKLNNQIRTILQDSFNDGSTKQERRILQAIKRGFKGYGTNAPAFTGNLQTHGAFFTVNDRKLNALVESTIHDMNKAEYAVLRRADDQYRQIIYNAQVYANTGAGTYEKAVDMATRDFLRAGINSIEYKNGSRHTISDYSDMAIRTATKRAYLQGEGEMRRGWGISTVILNKRSCPCPLCAPFVGKIFIDDVWSGGTAEEAKEKGYPLLSEAIAQGLYHPRCKDVHTTYFEGITTSEESYSKKELDEQKEKYTAEEKQAYCKRQEKRFSRMSKYSLDADNKRMYGARANEWRKRAEEYGKFSTDSPYVSEQSKSAAANIKSFVDTKMLNSSNYRRMFDRLGENEKMTRSIFQQAKAMLNHRSGSDFEDLCFIDSKTGKFLTRTDYNVEKQCVPSNAMKKMVEKAEEHTIISIHNHPNSTVPSLDDINTAWKKKYKYGIVVCHNGSLYKYKIHGEYDKTSVDMVLDRINSIIYNRDVLGNQFNLKLAKALSELRENNISLEVFLWK